MDDDEDSHGGLDDGEGEGHFYGFGDDEAAGGGSGAGAGRDHEVAVVAVVGWAYLTRFLSLCVICFRFYRFFLVRASQTY